ncbi:hypothetical protein VPH35_042059 [Triticum aestivum]|nr:FBD-associated F-box protein At5g38590-like isoform X2 [Triticum aestivum]
MAAAAVHPRGAKKTISPDVDRISLLPDEILGAVISFLPTDAAACTGALSRRWRHLWGSSPLDLDDRHIPGPRDCPDRAGAVSKILSEHQGPVRRLRIESIGDPDLGAWLRSPALDKLQEIDIDAPRYSDPLPLTTLRFAPGLRVARFVGCSLPGALDVVDAPAFSFPRLNQLALVSIYMRERALHGLSPCRTSR